MQDSDIILRAVRFLNSQKSAEDNDTALSALPAGRRVGSTPSHPGRKSLDINMLNQKYTLDLPIPAMGSLLPSPPLDMTTFLRTIPEATYPMIHKTRSQGFVDLMMPSTIMSAGARAVGVAFWSWLCIVDGTLLLL